MSELIQCSRQKCRRPISIYDDHCRYCGERQPDWQTPAQKRAELKLAVITWLAWPPTMLGYFAALKLLPPHDPNTLYGNFLTIAGLAIFPAAFVVMSIFGGPFSCRPSMRQKPAEVLRDGSTQV